MPVSRNSLILKSTILILVCGFLLTGCVPGGVRFDPDGWAGPVISDENLYVVSKEQSKLLALDLADNRNVLWKFAPEPEYAGGGFGCEPSTSSSLLAYGNPVVDDEMVYIASYDGIVYAINSGSATREYSQLHEYEMKKEKPKPEDIAISDRDKELNDLVDLGMISEAQGEQIEKDLRVEGVISKQFSWLDDAVEYKIVTEEQAEEIRDSIIVRGIRWFYDTDAEITSTPVLSGDVLVVASGSEVWALDAQKGIRIWSESFKADGDIWGTPAVYEGTVYFGTLDQILYAVDMASGNEIWSKKFDGAVAATPLIVNNTVYIGTFENRFYALDASSGEDKWDQPFEAENWFYTTPVYSNGTVYVGNLDHSVYALDAATGKAKWSRPHGTGNAIRSAPVIVENVLIVASKDGYVYGLNLDTGMQEWPKKYVDKKVLADLYTEGNAVYVLNHNDTLYALDIESGNQLWMQSLDAN